MMKTLIGICIFLTINPVFAQPIAKKLDAAIKKLEADSQMKHAIIGFCVVDTKTGLPVYEHNAQTGLAPASTQKLFTSGAAFELLGKDFRYLTRLEYVYEVVDGTLNGDIYIQGSGDPTFGSWRYASTKPANVFKSFADSLRKAGIRKINGNVVLDETGFSRKAIPDGWIWQDIGNYYGAGAWPINWKENQYDMVLKSSNTLHSHVDVLSVDTGVFKNHRYTNGFSAAEKGSGDNANIYLPMHGYDYYLEGTIPVGEDRFVISGSVQDPPSQFLYDFTSYLTSQRFIDSSKIINYSSKEYPRDVAGKRFYYSSPPLDSIIYWFLKRSINLYGEALVKTICKQEYKLASHEGGVEMVRDFWSQHGIEKSAIHIIDGSGLSPQNRVTTDALVKVLQYAKTRSWYNSFYYALPEYNGMKMKSGSIGGARAFAGYHTAKDGREYSYAIIINNYDGSSSQAVRKIYQVLDLLK